MSETIAIGARAGLVPLITHMNVQGHEQGQADTILGRVRDATARGTNTTADVYPYLAGQTGLVSRTIRRTGHRTLVAPARLVSAAPRARSTRHR